MARSLKERYETRKLQELKERLHTADRQLLEENRVANLITEAMDQEDLDKVSAIVKKLDAIKNAAGGDLKTLVGGIEQAQAELNKFTAGGPLVQAWTKLKGKFGIDNPIVKITTFASALERGFKQLPQILKNNGVSEDDLAKDMKSQNQLTLRDAIVKQHTQPTDHTADALKKTLPNQKEDVVPGATKTGTSDSGPPSIDPTNSAKASQSPKAAAQMKSIVAQMRKALSPGGVFGAFKKVPYVDSAALADDLLNAHVSNLVAVSRAVTSGPQSAEVAAGMKDKITGGGGEVGNAGTDKAADAAPTGQAGTTEPAKSTTSTADTTATGEKPPMGPGQKAGGGSNVKATKLDDEHLKSMSGDFAKRLKVDPAVVYKVMAALNASEKLRG